MQNLLVSFSGGETSAFMAYYLNKNYQKFGYQKIVFVFANTGLESEATLVFIEKCSEYFKIKIHWIESKTVHARGAGTTYTKTDYCNARRNGEPFEDFIKKYGIPNIANPQCSRELKAGPIHKFAQDYFKGEKYDTAIGIRRDEADRINAEYKKKRIIYPLIAEEMAPANKEHINFFWTNQPFRLELKGYQGNCVTCWKKSDKKLIQIAKESPESFNFMKSMEAKYYSYVPVHRLEKWKQQKKTPLNNITFFRENKSAEYYLEHAQKSAVTIFDDKTNQNYQADLFLNESCEIHSNCGDL